MAARAAAGAVVSTRAAVAAIDAPLGSPPPTPARTSAAPEPVVTVLSHADDPALVAASKAFRQFHANGDGVLSRAEAAADPALASRFDGIDRGGDGRIDRDEYSARR